MEGPQFDYDTKVSKAHIVSPACCAELWTACTKRINMERDTMAHQEQLQLKAYIKNGFLISRSSVAAIHN